MWSHVRGNEAAALDSAGLRGVVSFNTRERYFDPGQVVYSRGSYGRGKSLDFGLSVSWRQWSELLEDVESGKPIVVRCKTQIEMFPDKYETVFSWIEGSEPDAKGVVFVAHLFEGYTKRGANDNMSGCVVQLEILRALTKLIREGTIPQPRRNIYFIWPNEIGGTYDFIKHHKDLIDKWSININMDMVGEGLRQNNGVFTMSECPNHLPSYLDGLTASIMNYVWRTNDIVYLPDSPRGRRGGQYFPKPMVEKNGSLDAFRFSYHRATGGSDHICFNNPSVGVPGIELNIWPDQWYHADTDTPDKSDPTQMKRVAFIGASSAWTAANCTDEVLEGLLDAVSAFGYRRIADRELPKAIRIMETAHTDSLDMAMGRALDFVNKAVERESDVIQSTREIYSNSEFARSKVDLKVQQWKLYKDALQTQVKSYGVALARAKGSRTPRPPGRSKLEKQMDLRIPMIHPDVFGQEFYPERTQRFIEIMKTNPEEFQKIPLNRYQTRSVMNFVNGERSVSEIWKWAQVDTESDIDLEGVGQLLDFLESLDWIQYR